jgi:hypothetical protein
MNCELILKHFICPAGRSEAGKAEWDKRLADSLDWGCDWLDHLQDHMNPWPAQAVEELCDRAEALEAELADLKSKAEQIAQGLAKYEREFESFARNETRIKAMHLIEEGRLQAEVEDLKARYARLVEAAQDVVDINFTCPAVQILRDDLAAVKEKK